MTTTLTLLIARGRRAAVVLVALAALASAAGPATAQRREAGPPRAGAQFSYAPIVKRAAPGVVKRGLMKQVAREKNLSTDTSVDAVSTDWDAVSAFTKDFISKIAVRT